MTTQPLSPNDYKDHRDFWCPGCGDNGVLTAILKWCARVGIDPSQLVDSTGIGCSSKISEYHKCNGHHWLHGRSLPIATAIKLVNPRLIVMDAGGDGDGSAIGMEHFVHTCRRNPDLTYIVMNNQVYALTKGQAAPTSHAGLVTVTTPQGAKDDPVDMCELAIVSGATFVSRAYAFDQKQLADTLDKAFEHKGFSLVEILSPCPTYHKEPGYETLADWFTENTGNIAEAHRAMRDSLLSVADIDSEYDTKDRQRALNVIAFVKSMAWERKNLRGETVAMSGKMPLGILYVTEGQATLEENLGVSPDRPIVGLNLSLEANRATLERLMDAFR